MNEFSECLAFSHAAEDLVVWEEVYRKAFHNFVSMESNHTNMELQRLGVDRTILLSTGKEILVDEKVRGRSKTGRVYTDIALEYISVDTTNAPGWVCKSLIADYIAYLIAPQGICHLLPVIQLQAAWRKCGEAWKREFGTRYAINPKYKTLFCPVPAKTLWPEIGKEFRIQFTPFETEEVTS